MNLIHAVTLLAVIQYLVYGFLAGRARARSGIKAPAMTGDANFERALRVQTNTLEVLVAFLPAFWIAAHYWPHPYVAAIGAVYLIGRLLFWRSYLADPGSRTAGFILSILPVFVLLAMSIVGLFVGPGVFT